MYDQRGAGCSELLTDPARLGVDRHVADLEALQQRFHLKRMNLLGLSWGSAIVAYYASTFPQRVRRIVFLSPISVSSELLRERFAHLDELRSPEVRDRLRQIDHVMASATDEQVIALCREETNATAPLYVAGGPHARAPRADYCRTAAPAAIRNRTIDRQAGLASLGQHFDFRPMLAGIHAPSLVVEGEKTNVPLNAPRAWAAALANSRLVLIPEAGHRNWLDEPDRVFAALDVFFHSGWPQGAERP